MNVFLSHSQRDTSLATEVRKTLEAHGLAVFDAQVDVLPGDNWAETVGRALAESSAMVVLLTPDALESPWVEREIQYALHKPEFEGRLVPLVVGTDDEMPADRLPWILNRLSVVRWQPGDADPLRGIARSLTEAA